MELTNICRLCCSKNDLVWVFDKRFENSNSMRSVVLITTGVEINSTDAISQKICEKCCHITVNFFGFRKVSQNNDKLLKEKLKTITDKNDIQTAAPTVVEVKQEPMDTTEEVPNNDKRLPIHPTVGELFEMHPHIKLPRICLTTDVKPFVILPMDAVETYYKRRKLNFQEHCKLALKPRSTARKKTSVASKTRPLSPNSPQCLINARIIPQQYEDREKGLVQPIKLQIFPKSVPSENSTEKCSSGTEKTAPCHRKRKMTDDQSASKENEEPEKNCNSFESQEVLKSLSYVRNVSVPLHMCNICDTVLYNYKDLKKHRLTHLRCQFCKACFRSLDTKNEHLESKCLVKNTINNFPTVDVPRIENDVGVLTKYSDVFKHYPSIQSSEANSLKTVQLSNDSSNQVKSSKTVELSSESEDEGDKPNKCATDENTSDIIEILSDDDDATTINNNSTLVAPTKTPEFPPPITPDVKLKNNSVVGVLSPNLIKLLVLNNMLTDVAPSTLSTKEVQTEVPNERSIEINSENESAVLAYMKQHLHAFRVPVNIKNGPFQVSYNFSADEPTTKYLRFWNDITPVDVKVNNTGSAIFSQCINSSSGAITATEQSKSTAEAGSPVTTDAPIPTVVTSDPDNTSKVPHQNHIISNSESGSYELVNETLNHVSGGLSMASTFPLTYAPVSTNVTVYPSQNPDTSTSILTSVPALPGSTSIDSVDSSMAASSASHSSTLNTDNTVADFPIVSTPTTVPVSIDLKHLKNLHVFQVPLEIEHGPFNVSYNVSWDDRKTKKLQLWNDMTPMDIKINNTDGIASNQCINKSNSAMTQSEHTKLTSEAVIPSTANPANLPIPTVISRSDDADNTPKGPYSVSNSGSCSDKPISSTHNHISTVGLSAIATFPSKKIDGVPPTLASTTTDKRTSPPPTSTTMDTDLSVNVSVTSTSAVSNLNTDNSTKVSSADHTSTFNTEIINMLLNQPNPVVTSSHSLPLNSSSIVSKSLSSSANSSTSRTSTFNMDNNPTINVPVTSTSTLVSVPTERNNTQLAYGSTEIAVANRTSTFNTEVIDQPNPVVTTSYSQPLNSFSNVSKPVSSSTNSSTNDTFNMENNPSVNRPVGSTSALSPAPTALNSIQLAYGSPENSATNHTYTSNTENAINILLNQLNSLSNRSQPLSSSTNSSMKHTFNMENNSSINVPVTSTSTSVTVPTGLNNVQLAYGSSETAATTHTNTFNTENAINIPLNQANLIVTCSMPLTSSANASKPLYSKANSDPIDMSLKQSNPAAASPYFIPPNKVPITNKNPPKPIRFRVPSLGKTGLRPTNVFHNILKFSGNKHNTSQAITANSNPAKESQPQMSSTAYCTKYNQQTDMFSHPTTYTNAANVNWSTNYRSALPTDYSTGYSNVPVMVTNNKETGIPEAQGFTRGSVTATTPTSATVSNNFFPTALNQTSYPSGARRNSLVAPTNLAPTYIRQDNPSQSNYYNPNVRKTTADMLNFNSSTYSQSNSVQIGPTVIACPTPVGNPQLGHIRVKNMKDLT